ncbi:MAG: hypothetical protein WBF17_27970 [Phycisphaerae bacterium]
MAAYLSTNLTPEECRRRLESRLGEARWRFRFHLLGVGWGPRCDEPLTGRVGANGFGVVETQGGNCPWSIRVRGQWVASEGETLIELRAGLTRLGWAAITWIPGGLWLAIILLHGLAADHLSGVVLLAVIFGAFFLLATVLHSLQLWRAARRLVAKFRTLFEARSIEGTSTIQAVRAALRRQAGGPDTMG